MGRLCCGIEILAEDEREWPILADSFEEREKLGKFVKVKQLKKRGKASSKNLYKDFGTVMNEIEQRKEINSVDAKLAGRKIVKGKVTVDSGAAESVWPIDMVGDNENLETQEEMIGFVAANGARMTNYGKKVAKFVTFDDNADDSEKLYGLASDGRQEAFSGSIENRGLLVA